MKAASSSIAALQRPKGRLRPLALSLACIGLAPAGAQILPTNPTLVRGNAVVGAATALGNGGLAMGINQTSNRAILNWQSFSIGALDRVNITQPGAASVLLNRVTGAQASTIAGRLTANGHVFLVNPAGVTFSNGSQVSVGGLVASTLDIAGPDPTTRNNSFMDGGALNATTQRRELGFAGTSGASVTVEQGATIGTTSPGGTVALVGANVGNAGTLNVARGSVGMVSGNEVVMVVDPVGDGLTTFRIGTNNTATTAKLQNTGSITADGGRVQLSAASVSDVQSTLVNQSGQIRARSLDARGSEIVLGAGGNLAAAELKLGGTLDASGVEGAAGGTVSAVAGLLRVENASINVSGSQGGTAQLVGVSAASMAPDVTVRADATGANGNGGTVAVGSLGFAHVSGNLSAQGTGSGAGGQVLTSGGVIEVSTKAKVNASGGATGANGTWAVNSSLDLTVTSTVPAYDSAAYPTGATAVDAGAIGAALGRGTDVVLSSSAVVSTGRSEGIGVAFAPLAQVVKTEGRESTLTVNSASNIVMGKNSGIGSSASALNLNFNADSKGAPLPESLPINNRTDTPDLRTGAIFLSGATVQTAGGNVNFYGQSDPLAGRAVGLVSSTTDGVTTLLPVGGVTLTQSTVSTCAIGSEACTNGGSISMRGQGSSVQITDTAVVSSAGVDIMGSTLRTGSGSISLDGRGGLGSAGVRLAQADTQAGSIQTNLRSASGDVTLIGSTRARAGGGRLIVAGSGEGAGVAIGSTSLQTGGNVRIEGAGGAIDNVAIVGADGETPVSGQLGTSIVNSRIVAGAGRSISVTGTAGSRGFENVDGTLVPVTFDANAVQILTGANGPSMSTAGGQIRIDGQGGDVTLGLTADAGNQTALSVANPNGPGGSIQVDGRNILVTGSGADAILRLDATGAGQSGNVTLRARAVNGVAGSGILAMNRNVTIDANSGTAVGNGGEVRLLGERSLYAYGTVTARGGSAGGNGGFVETSGAFAIPETVTQNQDGFIGGGLVLNGFRADASAPAGKAGTWLIDPQNVTIQNGGATDTLPPGNPSVYVPLVDSTIQDSDISAALNAGTDVRITTGTGGPPDQGDIFMDDAQIVYNVATGTRTLTLDAHRSVRANGGTTIAAYGDGGPLNVVFNANANNASPPPDGGQVSYSGNIYTNGGNVVMNGSWGNATNLGASIALDGEVIDTRAGNQLGVGPGGYAGGSDALAGGLVRLNGRSNIAPLAVGNVPGEQAGAVFLLGTNVRTSTGDVNIFGSSTFGNGVVIDAVAGQGGIFTTSGNVLITGVGSYVSSSPYGTGHGVVIGNANIAFTAGPTLRSVNGNIALQGVRLAGGLDPGNGVQLWQRSLLTTTGSGNIEITGESQGPGAGVNFAPELTGTFPTIAAASVAGNNNVVLRAANDGSTDALAVGTGSKVSAANVLNLRPGGLDVQGGATNYAATAVDRTANPITLGGPAGTGFSVSSAELARMTAPTLVAGSNAHAADITVAGAIATTGALTLQNGAGGGIQLNAPVTAQRLGLISRGDITQAAGAPITAGTLLARSTAGNVLLENPANNVSASTLGGSAAGAFRYVDADTVQVGAVSVIGFDAGGNAPYVESATSMAADTVFVRTLTGDLLLGTNVTSGSGADLVAGARFQNLGSYGIAGAPWRVWADTWVGETRGGLAGSAPLPNFYNCAFAGFCGVTLAPGNHFIYRQQPDATVVVGNQARPFGVPNLPFTFSVAGLILGDTGAGFSGSFSTPGTVASLPGRYPINAAFTSAEGYRVTVVPGELFVTAALNRPLPDVLREIPQTWLYDRNIGQAPICLATGPLDGDRSSQGNDVLAREWSRVRSRPNLLSCVDTERRNGCADF